MNLRGIINQVTARGAGRPPMGGAGRPMGGPPAGPGGGMANTGARVGGMVGRFLQSRRGGPRI